MKEIEWRGFKGYEFEFEGLPANLIKPNCKPNGKQLLKVEYFDAFPEMEIEFFKPRLAFGVQPKLQPLGRRFGFTKKIQVFRVST